MFAFIERWKAKRKAAEWKRGYSYAKSELASWGDSAYRKLRSCVQMEKDFGCYDAFDKGVEAALNDWPYGES